MPSIEAIERSALSAIPEVLRKALLTEYRRIIGNFLERNWIASELSGGRFAELVFAILDSYASGSCVIKIPAKPKDFVVACKKLELHTHVPRSFQILIPRLLPVLYEIRNNRDVGHVGGDVNSNFMDATAVVSMVKWTLAELIRVFHKLDVKQAQQLADSLAERTLPILWKTDKSVRVLNNKLKSADQVILIASDVKDTVTVEVLMNALDTDNKGNFKRVLKPLHVARLIEFDERDGTVRITPKGTQRAEQLIGEMSEHFV